MNTGSIFSRNLAFSSAFLCVLLATACSAEKNASVDIHVETAGRANGGANATGRVTRGDIDASVRGGVGAGSGGTTAAAVTISAGAGGSVVNPDVIGDICAGVHVQASRVKPWILFVVDRSGSTKREYSGSSSRWQAMYDALMTPKTGVVDKLQSVAYFGMLLFDGGEKVDYADCASSGNCPDAGSTGCPRLVKVSPSLNNYKAIDSVYSQSPPGGTTPSALALEAAYKLVPSQQQVLDQVIGPQFVIYCTDGEPNGCEGGGRDVDPAARQGVIDQVTAASKSQIKTYVIGIAVDDEAQTHLNEVAQAGNTGSPAFSPATKDDLTNMISKIVGGTIGCNLKLNNTVTPGKECAGYVQLNSVSLTCNDPNGWKLADATHIELLGSACTSFMNDTAALLNAGFPCDSLVLK